MNKKEFKSLLLLGLVVAFLSIGLFVPTTFVFAEGTEESAPSANCHKRRI